MKKTTKKVEKKQYKKPDLADRMEVAIEDFKSNLKQVAEGVLMLSERMDRRFENVDLELSQIKDVVLDIQQEKASRTDVLALEKRVTKLEMNNARTTRK